MIDKKASFKRKSSKIEKRFTLTKRKSTVERSQPQPSGKSKPKLENTSAASIKEEDEYVLIRVDHVCVRWSRSSAEFDKTNAEANTTVPQSSSLAPNPIDLLIKPASRSIVLDEEEEIERMPMP